MSLILSIDNSTRGCSVALHQHQQLLANYDLLTEKSSSGWLTTLLQNVVTHAGFELADIDAVAVAQGPGSYTGLRIAVSTAKGLCFALDKPLIGIDTLAAMTAQIRGFYGQTQLFCPLIDARRMEVYCAVFDQNLDYIAPVMAKIVDAESFSDLLDQHKIVFFGDGASKCQPLLQHHANAVFLPTPIQPSAKTVGLLASQAFEKQQFEDLVSFEPYYLKDFMTTTPRKTVAQ
jgi:tRNA threonylcarbamoyladenosine biosynthesis protein TsaB